MEMVGLVLDDPGKEFLGHAVDPRSLTIVGFEPDRGVPWDHAAHVGHGETPLPAVLHLLGNRRHHRIDEHGQGNGGRLRIPGIALNLDDADLLQHMDLGRGEARPVVLAHGLDQVVDEALSLGRPDLVEGNGQATFARNTG